MYGKTYKYDGVNIYIVHIVYIGILSGPASIHVSIYIDAHIRTGLSCAVGPNVLQIEKKQQIKPCFWLNG